MFNCDPNSITAGNHSQCEMHNNSPIMTPREVRRVTVNNDCQYFFPVHDYTLETRSITQDSAAVVDKMLLLECKYESESLICVNMYLLCHNFVASTLPMLLTTKFKQTE